MYREPFLYKTMDGLLCTWKLGQNLKESTPKSTRLLKFKKKNEQLYNIQILEARSQSKGAIKPLGMLVLTKRGR